MRNRSGLLAAGIAGGIAGALIVLALPVPGIRDAAEPARPRVEPADVDTLLVWTPSQIPGGLAERIEDLSTVERLTVVRSGVAWMDMWTDGTGRLRSGEGRYAVPVEVAAVDLSTYRRFVPPADRTAFDRLRDGGALVGESSARLRNLAAGGRMRFGRQSFSIEGVVDDTLIGAHEMIVGPVEAGRLNIDRPRYILVAPRRGVDPSDVEAAIRRKVAADVRVRVRLPGETPVFRHGDAVLPQIQVKQLFGEFTAIPRGDGTLSVDARWEQENIVTGRVPVLGRVTCHRLILPLVRAALEDLVSRGIGRLVNPADFGGCYYPRYIASDAGTGLSHHSWGIAIDINVSEGLPGRQPSLDRRVVDAFERQGFIWGGRFLIPDGTHFEFQRFPS